MVVVTPEAHRQNMNKAYYRVVAVDANGVESCPSDFIAMPRPYVFTRPVEVAVVGEPYVYQIKTIRSLGDLQYRYIDGHHGYWEKEEYGFELVEGPAWLKLDQSSGLLRGTPSLSDVGTSSVAVRVRTMYPHEVPADTKSGEVFQKRRQLPVEQREHIHRFTITTVTPGAQSKRGSEAASF